MIIEHEGRMYKSVPSNGCCHAEREFAEQKCAFLEQRVPDGPFCCNYSAEQDLLCVPPSGEMIVWIEAE